LTKEQHRQLIFWACKCAENVLPLFTNTIEIAVARSIGHAAATAHMADHSLRAAEYALKAIKLAGISLDNERELQNKLLSPDILDLVLSARNNKTENTNEMK